MSRKRKKHVRPNRRPRPVSPPAAPTPPVPAMPRAEVQRSGGWWRFEALLCGVFLGLVGLLLFFWPTSAGLADAAKAAGRGYSAGSGGKSSSPPSGRGYSAGGGRPSPPSSGKRYSAGGSKPAPPPSPPVKVPRPSPPPTYKPTPPPLPKPTPPPLPSGKSGATGTGRSYGKGAATNPSAGTKPTGSYDMDAGRAQRREESRTDYQKSQQPKPTTAPTRTAPTPPPNFPKPSPPPTYTRPPPLPPIPRSTQPPTYSRGDAPKPNYTDPSGKPRPIDPNDVRVRELRRQLDAERWANRRQREQQAYGNFRPPSVTYSDPFHGLFHYWLLQQAAEERARWVYHHQSEMDRRRYEELLDKDRKLEERLREMETKRLPRDATFAPAGIDPDLVYSEAYAEAACNPKKVEPPPPRPSGPPQTRPAEASRAEQPPAVQPEAESRSDVPPSIPRPRSSILLRLLTVAAVVALFGFVVWLVFVKRWGGDV